MDLSLLDRNRHDTVARRCLESDSPPPASLPIFSEQSIARPFERRSRCLRAAIRHAEMNSRKCTESSSRVFLRFSFNLSRAISVIHIYWTRVIFQAHVNVLARYFPPKMIRKDRPLLPRDNHDNHGCHPRDDDRDNVIR